MPWNNNPSKSSYRRWVLWRVSHSQNLETSQLDYKGVKEYICLWMIGLEWQSTKLIKLIEAWRRVDPVCCSSSDSLMVWRRAKRPLSVLCLYITKEGPAVFSSRIFWLTRRELLCSCLRHHIWCWNAIIQSWGSNSNWMIRLLKAAAKYSWVLTQSLTPYLHLNTWYTTNTKNGIAITIAVQFKEYHFHLEASKNLR